MFTCRDNGEDTWAESALATFYLSDSLSLGTIPYSVCHPIPLLSPSTVLPGFQFSLTSLKCNHWHQAWHTMFALDVCWTATWASWWTTAHDHWQSRWSTSWGLCWFSTCRGKASCFPTKGTLAWKLGYLDSSSFFCHSPALSGASHLTVLCLLPNLQNNGFNSWPLGSCVTFHDHLAPVIYFFHCPSLWPPQIVWELTML